MSGLKLASVGVLAFVVLGSLMVPAGAVRPQVLAGQAAQTVGMGSSDVGNTIKAGMNARDKAKAASAEAGKRVAELDELTQDQPAGSSAPAGSAGEVYSAGEVVGAYNANPAMADKDFVGQNVNVVGVVVDVLRQDGKTLVKLMPPNATKTSPPFIVRMNGVESNYEKGAQVEFVGKFVGMFDSNGMKTFVMDVVSEGDALAVDAGVGSAAGSAVEKEPFDGWKFKGSVSDENGATGVFVKGDELLFAQPGDLLSDGVRVKAMSAGEAVLVEDGQSAVIVAW